MIYLKNLQTNEIFEFEHKDSIGVYFQDNTKFATATTSEIDVWKLNNLRIQQIKNTKLEEERRKLLISSQDGINIEMAGMHAIQCSELQSIGISGIKKQLTQDEVNFIIQCSTMQYQLNDVRIKSIILQQQILNMTFDELNNLNVSDNQYWI